MNNFFSQDQIQTLVDESAQKRARANAERKYRGKPIPNNVIRVDFSANRK